MKLNYRPEIDGLRAISVLAVIFYHLELSLYEKNLFQGGFLGVDFFFVISGYLITSLILKELSLTGSFSLKNFYERRARRILPALILVMLFSIPFAWKYLLPSSLIDYSKTLLYSLGFTSNFYFYNIQSNYFDLDSKFRPFLHTWSLSVEEQFYLLFPIFLLIIYKFKKDLIFKSLLILVILNLLLIHFLGNFNFKQPYINEELSFIAPSFLTSFYLTTGRIWEVLVGSILAYMEISKGSRTSNKVICEFFSFIGLILIFYSIFFFNDEIFHPSIFTFPAILGVALLIWFLNKDTMIAKILSNRFFVGVGLISYSLYLWHYPFIVFQKYESFSSENSLILLLLIFIASVISYFLIEKPFRNRKIIKLKYFLMTLVSSITILIIFCIFVIFNKGYSDRYSKIENINFKLDNQFYQDEWDNYAAQVGSPGFTDNKKRKILIIGNSFGRDFFNLFEMNKNLFNDYEFGYTDVPNYLYKYFDKIEDCKKIQIKSFDHEKFCESEIIIIADTWPLLNNESLQKIYKKVSENNKKLVLTNTPAQFTTFGQYTLLDYFILNKMRLPNESEKIDLQKSYYQSYKQNFNVRKNNEILKKFSKTHNIKLLDRNLYRCDEHKYTCDFLTDFDYKIYYDFGHYTLNGAKYFGKRIFEIGWLEFE